MIPQMSPIARTLAEAIAHHSAGRLAEAERLYRVILGTDPRQADANHNLGVIFAARGEYESAVPFFQAAFEANKKHIQFRLSLIEALIQSADYKGAGQLLLQAQRLDLKDPGFDLLRARLKEVTTGGPAALEAALRHQNFAGAEAFAKALTQDQPQFAFGWYGLAIAVAAQGRAMEAMPSFARAWELSGPQAEIAFNIGRACQDSEQFEQALGWYQAALVLDCTLASAFGNLSRLAETAKTLELSVIFADRAQRLQPDLAIHAYNLGAAFENAGDIDQAVKAHERASALRGPEAQESLFNLSLLQLLTGDFDRGWRGYETRFQLERIRNEIREPNIPRWTGQSVRPGTKILLASEQGFGDAIQFVRYALLVQARGFAVTVSVRKPLLALFKDQWPGIMVIDQDHAGLGYDYYCPLMSLPLIFNTNLASIPADIPYIHADQDLAAKMAASLGASKKTRIGLAWSGSATHARNHVRSMPLSFMAPLLEIREVEFYGVQIDIRPDDRAFAGAQANLTLRELNFAETAALMSCLDLMIGVDTAPVHLAAAMGIPTWIALHKVPDFRWMLNRTDSPWYPNVRLFRQETAGEWQPVISSIHAALRLFAGSP